MKMKMTMKMKMKMKRKTQKKTEETEKNEEEKKKRKKKKHLPKLRFSFPALGWYDAILFPGRLVVWGSVGVTMNIYGRLRPRLSEFNLWNDDTTQLYTFIIHIWQKKKTLLPQSLI